MQPMYDQYGRPYYPNPMDQLAQLRQQSMNPHYQQQPNMIWADDFFEAEKMQVPPGVPIWDRNKPYVYQKEVDGFGRPKTKRIRLVVEEDDPQPATEFVTWEKFNELMSNVSALANYVKSINKEANANE